MDSEITTALDALVASPNDATLLEKVCVLFLEGTPEQQQTIREFVSSKSKLYYAYEQ